jgi:hypothetical protein
MGMRWIRASVGAWPEVGLLLLVVIVVPLQAFCAEGVFQGRVVRPPKEVPEEPGWIFVQGSHSLRRVEVAHAVIVFRHQGSVRQGQRCGPECIEVGHEVLVTASQDAAGEWRARRVEILGFASSRGVFGGSAWTTNDLTKLNTWSGLLDNRSWTTEHQTRYGEIPEDGSDPGL